MRGVHLRADQRHDPRLRRREVAVEVDLQHRFDVRGKRHGRMRLLRHVRLGEALQRDDDLGLRLAQDGADLLGVEEWVDGVRDPRDGRTDESDRRLVAVGQDVGDHIAFPDAEAAEEVRSLGRLRVELAPRQGLGLVRGSGHDLEGDRVSVTMRPRGARQELVERRGHSAAVPRPHAFDLADIVDRRETAHAFLPVTPAFAPMCFDGARMGNSARVASRDRPGNATSGPYSAAMPSVNWSRARRA